MFFALCHDWQRLFCVFVLFAIVTGNSSNSLAADPDELNHFLQSIQKASDNVHSFSSDFIQEKELAIFDQPVIFHGKLAIIRPDRLRWEFQSPVPSSLLFEGDRGVRCSDQVEPVYFNISSDPVMEMIAGQLWLWLGGDYDRLSSLYTMKKKGVSSLIITPKDQQTSEFIETVTIAFDKVSLQPQQVEIIEPGGDLTRITFKNSAINLKLSEKLFSSCNSDE